MKKIRTQKRKIEKKEYSFLGIKVISYKADINASINPEVHDTRYRYDDTKIYTFGSRLDIEGICTYPEDREDNIFFINVYGSERNAGAFSSTLSDCHVLDDDRNRVYRKVRGKEVPVYDIPNGIGYLTRDRGTKNWSGCVWVPPRLVSDMLALLPHVNPLYLDVHELTVNRKHFIVGLSLQTVDPALT